MKSVFSAVLLGTALSLSAPFAAPVMAQDGQQVQSATEGKAWIERSNEVTMGTFVRFGELFPENMAQIGLVQFDGKAQDLGPDIDERALALYRSIREDVAAKLAIETDPNMRQDLQLIIADLDESIAGQQLDDQYMLDWYNIPQSLFYGIASLLDDQVAEERRGKAVELLQRYVGTWPDTTPLASLAKDRFEDSVAPGKIGPYRGNVEDELGKIDTYVSGVRDLFAKYDLGSEEDLDLLAAQMKDYGQWSRERVLPLARPDYRLPEPIYAHRLNVFGIDIPPRDLMEQARKGFYETRLQMQSIAPIVAAVAGMEPTDDYIAVIRKLKEDKITLDELEPFYAEVNARLEAAIAEHGVVSLPDYDLVMRLATPAEAAAQPAPHMRAPRLIGNTGERGQFILTVGDPSASGAEAYDDFDFDAASWTLSAHEARPGHELQFGGLVTRGVSQARALYAMNSVNAEGWALYAEAEMQPYEPIEAQMITLQFRLLRAARAMLDPGLNLGLIDYDEAKRVLREEVGLSEAMTKQELDRYTYRMPGQAGSYFYGYSRLAQLRIEAETALGDKFDRLAFNDFLLDQGILPPDMMAQTVREEFIPSQLAVE